MMSGANLLKELTTDFIWMRHFSSCTYLHLQTTYVISRVVLSARDNSLY